MKMNVTSSTKRLASFLTVGFLVFIFHHWSCKEDLLKEIKKLQTNNDGFFIPRGSRLVNSIVTDYKHDLKKRLQNLISSNAAPSDPALISLVRELMDPPSSHIIKMSGVLKHTPQSTSILNTLKDKKNGFFLEVGGLDGERSSNTLYLEQKYGWTGLLIEMDPFYYTQLRGKNRRSWSINACLSPYPKAMELDFMESSGGSGRLVGINGKGSGGKVPCFPLETLLLALNTTHIDYWSLDVEGVELQILKTVPFDRLDISTLSVEYGHGKSKDEYRKFMEEKGYVVKEDIKKADPKMSLYVEDFIFVKKNFQLLDD